jgi:hypothetical protein
MAFENGDATVEIVRCEMGVAHGHRQRLVGEPDLPRLMSMPPPQADASV